MRILVACEYSGRVREAFRKLGHDAWSCDILPSEDNSPYHIQGDVLLYLDKGWDMMIAHPPCTYLSNAGASWLYPKGKLNVERYALGLEGKDFFMSLLEADIPRICIENPVQSKVFNIPKYTQIIQPYYFGEPFSKRTCLWLKGLPSLIATDIVTYESTKTASWYNKGGKDRWKERSRTFQGIANAMSEQWGK